MRISDIYDLSRKEDTLATLSSGFLLLSTLLCIYWAFCGVPRDDNDAPTKAHRRHLYANEDGFASIESQAQFFDRSPGNLAALCATSGLLVSILRCGFSVLFLHQYGLSEWTQVGGWALLLIQGVILRLKTASSAQYHVGVAVAVSAICLQLELAWSSVQDFTGFTGAHKHGQYRTLCIFDVFEAIIAINLMIGALRIPARPDVFWDYALVDRQFMASAFERSMVLWTPRVTLLR